MLYLPSWLNIFDCLSFAGMVVPWSTTGILKNLKTKTKEIHCVENCLGRETRFQKNRIRTHSKEYFVMKSIVFWRFNLCVKNMSHIDCYGNVSKLVMISIFFIYLLWKQFLYITWSECTVFCVNFWITIIVWLSVILELLYKK